MAGSPATGQSGLPALPEGTIARALAFSDLAGWEADDHAAAFRAMLSTCQSLILGAPSQRQAKAPLPELVSLCAAALRVGSPDARSARLFFEAHCQPLEIAPPGGQGFLTAYFEPEVSASRHRTAEFPIPILGRPADLVTLQPNDQRPPGLDPALAAARRTSRGLEPYIDRAEIWHRGLDGQGLEIAWLRDETELFIIQVQGSARLTLQDGSRARLSYAGRNGHTYTSIGRILVEQGEIPLSEMSLARLTGWLRKNPARGRALMERNRSYVFFTLSPLDDPTRGPIGGAGVPLTAGRSLAVDRSLWAYGLPVWISSSPLTPQGPRVSLDRLMIAQDTGSAIIGPARGDFFMGSGADAGDRAGLVRDPMRFIVLWPRGAH
ncbi:MltA Membrane-bound lytic murein transglycosylase [Rhabdaerophilaceae bacterium]